MEHRLTREEIDAIINKRACLIDVRSDQEVAEKRCPVALHWDVQQMIEGRFPTIARDLPVFVFCRSGTRSAVAQRLLGGAGFTDAHNIGGLKEIPQELWG
jgi:phage shock protein E